MCCKNKENCPHGEECKKGWLGRMFCGKKCKEQCCGKTESTDSAEVKPTMEQPVGETQNENKQTM